MDWNEKANMEREAEVLICRADVEWQPGSKLLALSIAVVSVLGAVILHVAGLIFGEADSFAAELWDTMATVISQWTVDIFDPSTLVRLSLGTIRTGRWRLSARSAPGEGTGEDNLDKE